MHPLAQECLRSGGGCPFFLLLMLIPLFFVFLNRNDKRGRSGFREVAARVDPLILFFVLFCQLN
jgi:hypothetical protein